MTNIQPTFAPDENVATAPLAMLHAAGILCLPVRGGGTHVRIRLDDGTELAFTGITAPDEDGRVDDVSTSHTVREHGGWRLEEDGGPVLYDSDGKGVAYAHDTAALVDAVVKAFVRHGVGAETEGASQA
ncbi:hypothetical protein [Streptomyces sp. SP17KL33]|uniref:hypothetical protein n=1 Tax=Streptomyces sp. SP17KL33 TaxID=3002534 RepID=UPI002E762C45|nr:hypothetical protein [Streptomyces sp. SP17KL33]MEE1838169.1 hypothetical protein [Streptomyces sp. SP17KL33]